MGHKQTATHKFGKGSYHQVGLVRGQFGNVPMDQWLQFLQDTGFDGWEEASWELDLSRCATDAGAETFARERHEVAKHRLHTASLVRLLAQVPHLVGVRRQVEQQHLWNVGIHEQLVTVLGDAPLGHRIPCS